MGLFSQYNVTATWIARRREPESNRRLGLQPWYERELLVERGQWFELAAFELQRIGYQYESRQPRERIFGSLRSSIYSVVVVMEG